MSVKLEPGWATALSAEFDKPYMHKLKEFLIAEQQTQRVFPPNRLIFNAFNTTPFEEVKVIILGQDPYHNIGQAHGLSFSVPRGIDIPPSLRNIYKELSTDAPGFIVPSHGDLTAWAKQGVLLLNATLTVRAHTAASHQNRGWELFTDKAISVLSEKRNGLVFMLWGRFAQQKAPLIDGQKHLILRAAHPSPLSAHNGFWGCAHFSKANEYLQKQGEQPINWQV